MGKIEFLDALRRAMQGLPPETQAKTLAYYEQRFIDEVGAGRSEEDVATDLDDPKKIAMTLRASAHLHSFEPKKNPANTLRLMVSAAGLAIFNLFMLVPAIVYAALLATLYACALSFYLGGVAITASGLAGANEMALAGPLSRFGIITDEDAGMQTKVEIGTNGVHVFQEKVAEAAREASIHAAAAAREANAAARQAEAAVKEAGAAAEEAATAATAAAEVALAKQAATEAAVEAAAEAAAEAVSVAVEAAVEQAVEDTADLQAESTGRGARAIRRAESVAERGIQITTEMDPGSRATQTLFGFGMVLGGILLFLLSLVITKYTVHGVKRYIEMNLSLLKGS